MNKREMICIGCPMGCMMSVETEGENITVSGNTCENGRRYAINEVLHPLRVLTSSVPVTGGDLKMVSCKSAQGLPKEKIFAAMEEIHRCKKEAPIAAGEVLIKNVADTGVDVIATRSIRKEIV